MRFRPRRALILLATAMVLGLAVRGDGPAVFVSREVWTMEGANFGGWSGLEVSADGDRFTAISDRGWLAEGVLTRNALGRLTGVDATPTGRLEDAEEGLFDNDIRDAEGLAQAPDGRVFVAFEVIRRVFSYPDGQGKAPTALPLYRDFIALRPNMSLEALAIGADGALYTLPETARGHPSITVYRFDGAGWQDFGELSRIDRRFSQVGADIGPDGRFYLLERRLSPRIGFATRVRRFDLDEDGLSAETVLLQTRPGTHDNLEGLAVWRDPGGRIRLTMISDDNFGPYQKTEFIEYVVPN